MPEKPSTSIIRIWRVRVWGKEEGGGGRKQQGWRGRKWVRCMRKFKSFPWLFGIFHLHFANTKPISQTIQASVGHILASHSGHLVLLTVYQDLLQCVDFIYFKKSLGVPNGHSPQYPRAILLQLLCRFHMPWKHLRGHSAQDVLSWFPSTCLHSDTGVESIAQKLWRWQCCCVLFTAFEKLFLVDVSLSLGVSRSSLSPVWQISPGKVSRGLFCFHHRLPFSM